MIYVMFFKTNLPLFFLFVSLSLQGKEITLEKAYHAALERERFLIEEGKLKQLDYLISEARSRGLPEVNLRANILTQEKSSVFSRPEVDRTRKGLQVEVIQPVFKGFREFTAVRLAEAQRLAQLAQLEQTKIDIFISVYQVFFQIHILEEDRKNISEQLRLSSQRVQFLRERVSIGRSRESELLGAQAQEASVRSQLESLNLQLISARERFTTLTGFPQSSPLSLKQTKKDWSQKNLDELIQRSLASSWQKVEEQNLAVAQERVKLIQADFYPEVELRANYYPYREGQLENVGWDVGLFLTYPLYNGGETRARVRGAREETRQASLRLSLRQREIEESVRVAYQKLLQGQGQVQIFRRAVEVNKKNYELLLREYGLGLVSNLDVLAALNQYIQSQKDLSRLILDNAQYAYELKALVGDLF